jgi:hypothetical protein
MANKGALALLRAAKNRGFWLQKHIAGDTGLDEPRVSRLLSGKIKPNRAEAVSLREKYSIDPALWDVATTEHEAEEVEEGLPRKAADRMGATGTDDAKGTV